MSSSQANHDPALSHSSSGGSAPAPSAGTTGPSNIGGGPNDLTSQLGTLDSTQILSLLRHLPGVFNKLSEQGNLKEDAAQTLSNLSQSSFSVTPGPHGLPQMPYQHNLDPGPSSHPRGPPNLGQLSALAAGAGPPQGAMMGSPPMSDVRGQEMEEGGSDDDMSGGGATSGGGRGGGTGTGRSASASGATGGGSTGGRTRGNRSATMGSDEWSRQRKDNHKEVERRRRGNINDGINELGRIVPNGSGEKAKGAILSRAVQYIHHLKENEARNIEKWTLEKLLMDQAMGDLQAQLEEVRRLWEEERVRRQRAEDELVVLRGPQSGGEKDFKTSDNEPGKRRSAEAEDDGEGDSRNGKRQRVD